MDEERFDTIVMQQMSELNDLKACNGDKYIKELEQSLEKQLHEKSFKLKELEREHEDLSRNIMELENKIAVAEEELQNELADLARQEKNLEEAARENKVLLIKKEQYKQRLAKASARFSSRDLQLFDTLKKKLEAYKRFTGVSWDYTSCNEKCISGYIRSADDSKLKLFQLNIEGKDREDIVSEMWKLIEKNSGVLENNC